jgi:hypothetical protein
LITRRFLTRRAGMSTLGGPIDRVPLIAVHAEQLGRAQHGRQRKLDRKPLRSQRMSSRSSPCHIILISASVSTRSRVLLVALLQMDAS